MTSFGTDNPTLLALVKKKEPTPKVPKKTPTKPTKSIGVKGTRENRALLLAQNPPAISEKELANIRKGVRVIDSFNIKYTDRQRGARVFNFALPPAVDNILTYSGSGSFRGNASVPDVKAGLPIRTTMKHKNIVIPGGTNVVQTIGVDSKYIVLVGAFIGSEEFSTKPKTPGVSRSSYQTAKEFDERVVQQGAPISLNVTINAAGGAETIDITGVIVDFKAYAVRRAKTYYSITVLYTKYPKIKPPVTLTAEEKTQVVTETFLKQLASEIKGKKWEESLVKEGYKAEVILDKPDYKVYRVYKEGTDTNTPPFLNVKVNKKGVVEDTKLYTEEENTQESKTEPTLEQQKQEFVKLGNTFVRKVWDSKVQAAIEKEGFKFTNYSRQGDKDGVEYTWANFDLGYIKLSEDKPRKVIEAYVREN